MVSWLVRSGENGQDFPLLTIDGYSVGSKVEVSNPFSVSGVAKSTKRGGVLNVFYLIDDDYQRLQNLVSGVLSGDRFSGLVFCDFCEREHFFSFHAIDEEGLVSRSVSFTGSFSGGKKVSAVALPPGKVEIEESESGAVGGTAPATLLSQAVTLAKTDLFFIRAGAPDGPPSDAGNFDVWGLVESTPIWFTARADGSTTRGFATRMRISDSVSESASNLAAFSFLNVTLKTSVLSLTNYSVLVRFQLINENSATTNVDLECDADLSVDGKDNAALTDFNGTGFTLEGSGYWLTILCKSCPLVRDVSTYWIGSNSGRADYYWNQSTVSDFSGNSACAWSWQGLSIPAGGSTTVGIVFESGLNTSSPRFDLFLHNETSNYTCATGEDFYLYGHVYRASSWRVYRVPR
jgi:hypothetical protein